MFHNVYLHSCLLLLLLSCADTASGPVWDVRVYLWACFPPSLSETLSLSLFLSVFFFLLDLFGVEKQWLIDL